MKHNCKECNHVHDRCTCRKPNFIGCVDKVEFTCVTYTGDKLIPTNIDKGDNGDLVIKKLNDYIEKVENEIEIDPTLIESIGGKEPIYNGISPAMIHEIKSIQGEEGIIIETIGGNNDSCTGSTAYINVRLDRQWLVDNICEIIAEAGCGTTPPSHNPVVTPITKSIVNRGYADITEADFQAHYTDADGHLLSSITITGSVNGFKLNGVQITNGQEIQISQLTAPDSLRYTADDVNNLYTKTVSYIAKDSSGAVSNTSQIIITVAAKIFVVFSTPTVPLIREINNNVDSSISFSNGTGQIIPNGYAFISQGTPGQPGYLKITSTAQVTMNNSGTIPIKVVSHPTATQANQTVNYVIDGSTGHINLTYNSNPTNTDVVKNTPYNTPFNFTTLDFLNSYSDFDSDNMIEMKAEGVMDGYSYDLNGTNNYIPYVAGTWIPVNNIARLKYTPLNQVTAYQKVNPWFAKDSQGNISI